MILCSSLLFPFQLFFSHHPLSPLSSVLCLLLPRERGRCVVREHLHHQCNSNYFIDIPCLITLLWIICINLFPFLNHERKQMSVILLGWFNCSIHYVCLWASPFLFCRLCLSRPAHNTPTVYDTKVTNHYWAFFPYIYFFLNYQFLNLEISLYRHLILMNPIILISLLFVETIMTCKTTVLIM